MEKEKFGRADTDTEKQLIDADLLILDDLGAESTTFSTAEFVGEYQQLSVQTLTLTRLKVATLKVLHRELLAHFHLLNLLVMMFVKY